MGPIVAETATGFAGARPRAINRSRGDDAGYRWMTPGLGSRLMESRLTLPLSSGPYTKVSGVVLVRRRLTWCSDQVSQFCRAGSRSWRDCVPLERVMVWVAPMPLA